jgi:glycosyltransferase involved in cell wall biosynthesis
MKKISVGIITYMRPIGLEKILSSFKLQTLEDIELSIIVVDNDATGENQKVIDKLKNEGYPYKLDLFVETKRGIVAARNRTVSEFLKTDSESMIFVDDDEWPVNHDWIMKMVEVEKDYNADIVYSDVNIIPETDEINWVQTAYKSTFGNEKSISPTKSFFTGNLLVKRAVYEKLNPPFDDRFAMTGSSDLHFCIKANNCGYKAYYTPYAPVEEIFPKSRATFKWFFLRGYRTGEGATRANMYEGKMPSVFFYIMYLFFGRLVRTIQMFILLIFTFDKGYLARTITYLGATIGTITGFFGLKYNEYNTIHGK